MALIYSAVQTTQILSCSVCKLDNFSTKYQLISHLLEKSHLDLLREAWGGDTLKQRCLVISCSGVGVGGVGEQMWNMDRFEELFGKIGNDEDTDNVDTLPLLALVKNFVWWEDRERTCIVEFETVERAERAFNGGLPTLKRTKMMYLKPCKDLHVFEWFALFPEAVAKRLETAAFAKIEEIHGSKRKRQSECDSLSTSPRRSEDYLRVTSRRTQKVLEGRDKRCDKDKVDYDDNGNVSRLKALLEEKGWEAAQYFLNRDGGNEGTEYVCHVRVNGVEWASARLQCKNRSEAKNRIAEVCIKNIQSQDKLLRNDSVGSKRAREVVRKTCKNVPNRCSEATSTQNGDDKRFKDLKSRDRTHPSCSILKSSVSQKRQMLRRLNRCQTSSETRPTRPCESHRKTRREYPRNQQSLASFEAPRSQTPSQPATSQAPTVVSSEPVRGQGMQLEPSRVPAPSEESLIHAVPENLSDQYPLQRILNQMSLNHPSTQKPLQPRNSEASTSPQRICALREPSRNQAPPATEPLRPRQPDTGPGTQTPENSRSSTHQLVQNPRIHRPLQPSGNQMSNQSSQMTLEPSRSLETRNSRPTEAPRIPIVPEIQHPVHSTPVEPLQAQRPLLQPNRAQISPVHPQNSRPAPAATQRPVDSSARQTSSNRTLAPTFQKRVNGSQRSASKCPLQVLNDLAKSRNWLLPQYFLTVIGKHGSKKTQTYKYFCTVLIDSVEWARDTICATEIEAKRQIARKALENISLSTPNSGPTNNGTETAVPLSQPLPPPDEEAEDFWWEIETENWGDSISPISTSPSPPLSPADLPNLRQDDATNITLAEITDTWMDEESQLFASSDALTCKVKSEQVHHEEGPVVLVVPEVSAPNESTADSVPRSNTKKDEADCPIKKLEKLVTAKGWGEPEYYSSKQLIRESLKKPTYEYTCRVVVNEVEYQPDLHKCPGHKSRLEAMRHISSECLEKLINSDLLVKSEKPAISSMCDRKGNEEAEEIATFETFVTLSSVDILPSYSFPSQYMAIRKAVLIADNRFKIAVNVSAALDKLFSEQGKPYRTFLYGNWALKLKNSNMWNINEPQIYLCSRYTMKYSPELNESFISSELLKSIFDQVSTQFTIMEAEFPSTSSQEVENSRKDQKTEWKILYRPSATVFSLLTSKTDLFQVQTCRLLEYLCTFDVRCHHLIVLAQYWQSTNSINFGETDNNRVKDIENRLPGHLTLPWLVIFFFCRRGLLPTPREILKRPHISLIDPGTEIDIGFSADPNFAKSWKPLQKERAVPTRRIFEHDEKNGKKYWQNFTPDLLQLLKQFQSSFRRMTAQPQLNWILNVMDAELINQQTFLTSPPKTDKSMSWASNMTLNEISALTPLLNATGQENSKETCKTSTKICPWYMTSPFMVTSKFSVSSNVHSLLLLMDHTCGKLDEFLEFSVQNKNGSGGASGSDKLEGLENCLKINKAYRDKILENSTGSTTKM